MADFAQVKRQILDRLRIEDVVSEHVTLRRSGRRLIGLCPFHSEKTPSFTVNSELGFFKCFGCGKGGDVFTFVQEREGLHFMEALRLLADRTGVVIPSGRQPVGAPSDEPSRTDILRALGWAQQHFKASLEHPALGQSARAYLAGRGFTTAIVAQFGLGLAAEGSAIRAAASKAGLSEALLLAADLLRQGEDGRCYDTFRHRVMFPIRDASGRVVGFGGRTLGDDKAKYINTRQTALFDKGRTLYALDLARESVSARHRVIVVEGYTDCMACHQAGFAETVATLGTSLTEHHVEMLRRFADEVVLLFDSDDAGEAAADRAINLALPRSVQVRLARVPEGKDPGEFLTLAGGSAFSDVLNSAVDALEFKWSLTRARFGADATAARQREAVLAFVRLVAEAAGSRAVDAIQYGLLVNQVSHLLGVERAEVARLMESTRPSAEKPRRAGEPAARREVPAAERASSAQGAWGNALEVLLNDPGLAGTVSSWPPVDLIQDPRDRRIAEFVLAAVARGGPWGLSDILARCEAPAEAQRVVQRVERGAIRGNLEATLRLALERLARSGCEQRQDQGRQEILAAATQQEAPAVREAIRTVADGAREHRHFAPRRLRRQATSTWSAAPGDATETGLATERP